MKITSIGALTILSFTVSILFCIVSWVLTIKKSRKSGWASACSLSFVAITLLMEYRAVLEWVNKADWTALMDVVPSTFSMLCGYVILMLVANVIILSKRSELH